MFEVHFVGGSSDGYWQYSEYLPLYWHGPVHQTDEWYKLDFENHPSLHKDKAVYLPCSREDAEKHVLLAEVINLDWKRLRVYLDKGLQSWIESGPSKPKQLEDRV